jgi:RNA polymerase sigma factor (sigma-70 family)
MHRRYFFRLLSSAASVGDLVSDGVLLRRFAQEQDTPAFELLVRRHADAVWTACRGVLASEADAEDAFQATFLVLARKARTVRREHIGGWLHRVAVNAALKLRARSARVVIATSEQLDALPAPESGDPDADLSALVQEELAGLPERYRLPVVLCALEGHTHDEAAKALGWPVGTVSSRLSRARTLLRERLARRGVSAPAVVLPALGLPPALVRDATAVVVGVVPILPKISSLTEGVLSMMRFAQYKLLVVRMASVGLLAMAGFGTYTVLGQGTEVLVSEPIATLVEQEKQNEQSGPKASDVFTAFPDLGPKDTDDFMTIKPFDDLLSKCPNLFGGKEMPLVENDPPLFKLLVAKLNVAIATLSRQVERYKTGKEYNYAAIVEGCNRVVTAAADVLPPNQLAAWFEERVRVAKWYENFLIAADVREKERIKKENGGWAADDKPLFKAVKEAQYARLDAEIALLKLTTQKAGKGGR